jgi:Caspase domain
VKNESTKDHSQYDAFILFILSHGLNGYVLGTDEKTVAVDWISQTVGSCKTLHRKPKMLFFQACRSMFMMSVESFLPLLAKIVLSGQNDKS